MGIVIYRSETALRGGLRCLDSLRPIESSDTCEDGDKSYYVEECWDDPISRLAMGSWIWCMVWNVPGASGTVKKFFLLF
jgi:hypothetical protein